MLPNGGTYDGDWKRNLFDGWGKLTSLNGESFEGEFVSGKRHGFGRMTLGNGDIVEGTWRNDEAMTTETKRRNWDD